jgi:hypothetical protein
VVRKPPTVATVTVATVVAGDPEVAGEPVVGAAEPVVGAAEPVVAAGEGVVVGGMVVVGGGRVVVGGGKVGAQAPPGVGRPR